MNRWITLTIITLAFAACTSSTKNGEEQTAPPRVYIYNIDCTDYLSLLLGVGNALKALKEALGSVNVDEVSVKLLLE
ncbi:MAG: hypothetical protein J6R31_00845, partial [Rikenellaceae bacterium]|nr:hypothetical protein [Rikenellaceae bacterium]